jgi:antitoxin VapB
MVEWSAIMPASLNIKNAETHRLAEELAELTGESMAAAVQAALRERLERLRCQQDKAGLAERLLAIGRDAAAHMTEEERTFDYDAWLYDERGLPR